MGREPAREEGEIRSGVLGEGVLQDEEDTYQPLLSHTRATEGHRWRGWETYLLGTRQIEEQIRREDDLGSAMEERDIFIFIPGEGTEGTDVGIRVVSSYAGPGGTYQYSIWEMDSKTRERALRETTTTDLVFKAEQGSRPGFGDHCARGRQWVCQ